MTICGNRGAKLKQYLLANPFYKYLDFSNAKAYTPSGCKYIYDLIGDTVDRLK